METSVRLHSGFVNSSANRHVSIFWMAVGSFTRASGALDEAVTCETLRGVPQAHVFSLVEFRFAVEEFEKTRALLSMPRLRWTMLGIRKTPIVLQ